MSNIHISDLTTTELQELDLLADSEGYLQELSEQELNLLGGFEVAFVSGDKSFGVGIGFSVGGRGIGFGVGVGGVGNSPTVRFAVQLTDAN